PRPPGPLQWKDPHEVCPAQVSGARGEVEVDPELVGLAQVRCGLARAEEFVPVRQAWRRDNGTRPKSRVPAANRLRYLSAPGHARADFMTAHGTISLSSDSPSS